MHRILNSGCEERSFRNAPLLTLIDPLRHNSILLLTHMRKLPKPLHFIRLVPSYHAPVFCIQSHAHPRLLVEQDIDLFQSAPDVSTPKKYVSGTNDAHTTANTRK
jgi:hypothetical protein